MFKANRQHAGTLMVGTQVSWWPDGNIFRSTAFGATWTRLWDWGSWTDRTLRSHFGITATPWYTMGAQSAPPILVPKIGQADNIGFGKPAPGRTYPALYTAATIDGQRGVFRSDDTAKTWTRIKDDRHQYGGSPDVLTRDPDTYGRVYLSGYGRCVIYGDPARVHH